MKRKTNGNIAIKLIDPYKTYEIGSIRVSMVRPPLENLVGVSLGLKLGICNMVIEEIPNLISHIVL